MARSIQIKGIDKLQKKLRKNATMADVKTVVKTNTAELTGAMQRESQTVLTGHMEGGKFVNPTGATKRSIVMEIADGGLTGKTGPHTEYSPYLIYGTRFMAKRDFFTPPLNRQKAKFKSDIGRLVK